MDYFRNDASSLKEKKLWLFDMDGTIYEEDRLFDGTIPLLDEIKKQGGTYVFITNNSSKSVDDYVKKVNGMGIQAGSSDFFTSVDATVLYLNEHAKGKTVYVMGTESMIKSLVKAGIDVTTEVGDAEVVLIGFDTELTSEKLRKTCEMLTTRDVMYLATNPDYVCPVSFGFIPDCGSIAIMLYNATKKNPKFIGKPEPTMVNAVAKKLGYKKSQIVVVGDRLYTDIKSGLNAGVDTICVLSGEATVDDILNGDVKPTYTFLSVTEILEEIK
ncbi:MAG: HAD-IIA family hydrolase [Clostridia bacterium]|nr:HAD-IIA family hydrolase [Clostridia bacterium]